MRRLGGDRFKTFQICETVNRLQFVGRYAINAALVPASRVGIGDDEIVESPVQLQRPIVGRRDDRNSCCHFQQHTKSMGASHMRMQQIELLGPCPITYSADLAWRTIHLTVKNFAARYILLLHPALRTTENRYIVSARDQLLRKKLTIRQRAINVPSGNKLQDFQGKGTRYRVRIVGLF